MTLLGAISQGKINWTRRKNWCWVTGTFKMAGFVRKTKESCQTLELVFLITCDWSLNLTCCWACWVVQWIAVRGAERLSCKLALTDQVSSASWISALIVVCARNMLCLAASPWWWLPRKLLLTHMVIMFLMKFGDIDWTIKFRIWDHSLWLGDLNVLHL